MGGEEATEPSAWVVKFGAKKPLKTTDFHWN